MLIPFLSKYMKLDATKARATAIFTILFYVIVSSFFYFRADSMNFELAIKCAIGGVIGSFIGSKLLVKFSSKFLNLIFIIFLFYSGIKMI